MISNILLNENNMEVKHNDAFKFDLIYGDYIYNNMNFDWVDAYWHRLKENSIFMVQTDDSSFAEMKLKLDSMENSIWINTVIVIQEWGGVPTRAFPRKHDYVLIYANGKDYYWDSTDIRIPKKTAGTKFDKKGTGTKVPCSVFYDLGNFSTMSKERVKKANGKNIQWQKPLKLYDRLFTPLTKEGDIILDLFAGVGSVNEWCLRNRRRCFGFESEKDVFDLSCKRLSGYITKFGKAGEYTISSDENIEKYKMHTISIR